MEAAQQTPGIIVVKIGGSTLGSHDTALEDVAALHAAGRRIVVVHGGGALVSEWLARQGIAARFEGGLRVTDEASLEVVVAVLAGLVNKQLVAALAALSLGSRVLGISGTDGGLLRARVQDPTLGRVGEVQAVDPSVIEMALGAGWLPVVAPVAIEYDTVGKPTGSLLNVNADTAAGEIAAALHAERLVFLTDVPGIQGSDGNVMARIRPVEAAELIAQGIIAGGMIPKARAALLAASGGTSTQIIDGRESHALRGTLEGGAFGTAIG
ncbi:MAG: acetylglutamate kinase [Dehalococcoidia bacterium]|nr:acetylglutamate kinase [Dehalococcoidia bacterium]